MKWTFRKLDPAATELLLDTKGIVIKSVTAADGTTPIEWKLGADHEAFGSQLSIALPAGDATQVVVTYATSSSASAIQWLLPAMTAGKAMPFLFTQCQAIHARSLLPCQDTPQVKVTYNASVTVPKGITALMSALGNGDAPTASADGAKAVFQFKQPVAMAAYLIAIAAGDLKYSSVSKRCGVWAETAVIEKAAFEFSETEQFLAAAEEVCGPYEWGRYDVLCMPPSFPYGGMENPCLTFVTPTLLAGDRSLAAVVIHEIAHSWTGNLVTNQSWRHFWLNEGWTMFVQRKIMALLYGKPLAEFDATKGLKAMTDSIDHFGCEHNFTSLLPDLKDIDPDDAFSSVPYEKGFNFITYLEKKAGGEEAFKPFIKEYLKAFAFKTLTSYDFKAFYLNYFSGKAVAGLDSIDWGAWLNGCGMPPVVNVFDPTLLTAVEDLKAEWLASKGSKAAAADIAAFKPAQMIGFLDVLQDSSEACKAVMTDPAVLKKMGEVYKFSSSGNAEIKFRWCLLCIAAEMSDVLDFAVAFLLSAGRMKFVRPLFRALYTSKVGKQLALDTFAANRQIYHPICAKMVAKDIDFEEVQCIPIN